MSVLKRFITMTFTMSVALFAMVMPVLAATEQRQPPGELAVRIFLGFCALIIVAQLLPLARQTLRKLSEKKATRVEATEVLRDK
jgi:predicted membrane channel-forming protein YqfA (hemolysin III family)